MGKGGVGAVATQAAGVAVYGPQTLAFLEGGLGPEAALEQVLAGDSARESRQLGAVAADGSSASFTGAECLAWAGHRTGDGYAVQGNILAGEAVVVEMERAFLETGGSLAERLVSALEAGQAAGGDSRGQQSAAIVVEREGAASESREGIDRVCELRVEDHPTPIAELRRLLGIHGLGRAAAGVAVPRARGGTRGRRDPPRGPRGAGGGAVLLYDLACFESLSGETEAAFGHIARSLELDAGLKAGAAADSDLDALRSGPAVRSRSSARLACGMDLYEYQGKELFRRFGIPVSDGRLATTPEEARAAAEELGGPVVVKAQVLTGGRGKAGGIKLPTTPDEAEAKARRRSSGSTSAATSSQALDRAGLGHREGVLPLDHVRPRREAPLFMFTTQGGVDIEEVAATKPTRSSGSTSTRSRASSPGRRAGSSTAPGSRTRTSRSRSPRSSGSSTRASSSSTRCSARSTR